ncbi:glycine--tRNA ligase subunit beta [Lactococcus insecticola]|uniref:Glycine--tRNA ligase beta subunit n=1 Tax=Pseudolactococcus insecticola TaxID=2709158 RepID=A0A6A0B5V4_9LACT|nr:glycine--tRNA ligase subunit beta [Lactococcus insecticola]GFH39898.1 glycine--tRNA ligase beta subunit [Lactococcus insecticola]
MANYLLEIGLEEMPAHLVSAASAQLEKRVADFLAEKRVKFDTIVKYATPRRLAVLVKGLSDASEAVDEEVKGPSEKIAKDADGNWSKAIQGFSRGQGVTPDDLVLKGDYYYANKHISGVPTSEILTAIGDDVIAKMQFSTYMKWANNSFLFVRPIQWLVSLLDDETVSFKLLDVTSNAITRGHRFLYDEPIVLKDALDYEAALNTAFVIADSAARKTLIETQIAEIASTNSWDIYLEPGLLEEVNNLVEYPTAFVGDFEAKYLDVPEEVLVTSMREHQRYFEVRDLSGNLQNHFISVRNGNAEHIENVAKGNQKVLVARLEDAEFFWREDQKLKISDLVEKLKKVTFHEKIGSVYEHMGRVKIIAKKLRDHAMLPLAFDDKLDRAADIYKFDLLTGMVGEFDELQGIMGEKYALLAGEDAAVATSIREHYMPTSADGDLPETEIGAVLAVADKLDTILSFFTVGLIPSGSNDPYALRRATAGILRIIDNQKWAISLETIINELYSLRLNGFKYDRRDDVISFINGRVAKMLSGIARRDIIDAVLATESLDVARLTENAQALDHKTDEADFKTSVENLSRVFNLASKLDAAPVIDETQFENAYEKVLFDANQALVLTDNVVENVEKLFDLSTPISNFFDNTMVMTDNSVIKYNRLSLLSDIASKASKIADFTLINTK